MIYFVKTQCIEEGIIFLTEAMIQENHDSSNFFYKFWVSRLWLFKVAFLYQLSVKIVNKCCENKVNIISFTDKSNNSNLRCALMEGLEGEDLVFCFVFGH